MQFALSLAFIVDQISDRKRFMGSVIDDDRDSSEALADFLAIKGYVARCVKNGNDAFALNE
jgi:hypothetical protein